MAFPTWSWHDPDLDPCRSPIAYHCPTESSSDLIMHHVALEFPALPLMQQVGDKVFFSPDLQQLMNLQSSPEMSKELEKGTRNQSKCPAWAQLQQPRLTATVFLWGRLSWEGKCRAEQQPVACSRQSNSSSYDQRLHKAYKEMWSLDGEKLLANYAELARVNVLPFEFVILAEAPHLRASPDWMMYDPTRSPHLNLLRWKAAWKILSVRCYASRSRTMQVWGFHTGITCRFRASWHSLYQNGVTVTVCVVAACFVVTFLVVSLAVCNQRQLRPPTGPKRLFSGEPTEPTKCLLQIRETPIHIQTTRTSPMLLLSRQPI